MRGGERGGPRPLPPVGAAVLALSARPAVVMGFSSSGSSGTDASAAEELNSLIRETVLDTFTLALAGLGEALLLYYCFELGLAMNSREGMAVGRALTGISFGITCLVFPAILETILAPTVLV